MLLRIFPGVQSGLLLGYLPWLVLLGYLTHTAWFLCDDAFISFRYARNLLEGHGLVYNPGEYVEGYSNFLWVLELAVLWGAFGLRPEHTAPWLSVACTAGTLAALLWWVARLPGLPHRGLVSWMALGLVCSSATFAVWTSGGGLETRQFTFFIVLAVVGLTLYPERRQVLLGVSLSLAAAALTRPEGPLFAACCFAWYAMQRRLATGRWLPDWHTTATLVVPCVGIVVGHYLFRYGYYGEWLPNTYYAKYVAVSYERGVAYLAAVALETGLYLLLPLTVLSLVRSGGGLPYALPLLFIVLHMAYIARIGGGLFEYRLLDFYWPLLAVPAATGIIHLGMWASSAVRRVQPLAAFGLAVSPGSCTLAIFLPVVFSCYVVQATLLFAQVHDSYPGFSQLKEKNILWSLVAPGMHALDYLKDDLMYHRRGAGLRFFARRELRKWRSYQNSTRGIIPAEALALTKAAGIKPYFIPDLKFIDFRGLTDTTIARNPITHRPNRPLRPAHSRRPTLDYLRKRGVNFQIHPAATSEEEAFTRAIYAVQVGPDLWLPFDAPSLDWVADRFAQFVYDAEAVRCCEEKLTNTQGPSRDRFEVSLGRGNRLLYVKVRCTESERRVFFHVTPKDVADLPAHRRQHGFENFDFNPPMMTLLGVTRCCTVVKELPSYPIASVRTGQRLQDETGRYRQIWKKEFHFTEGAGKDKQDMP